MGNSLERKARQGNRIIRDGVAPLELVLCLPVLLALIVGVVWLGNSVIAQTNVTIEARHKTWSQREESSTTALLFLKDDVVSEQASKEVSVSPMFDDTESPESSHDVMGATWDFEKIPLDKAPNWKQYALAAANAKTGALQNGYVDATNKFNQFQNESRNVWKTILDSLIKQLTNFGQSADSQLQSGDDAGAGEKQNLRSRIGSQLEAKKQELKDAKESVKKLDDGSSKALKQVLENRVKRLRAEIKDLESDLEAME